MYRVISRGFAFKDLEGIKRICQKRKSNIYNGRSQFEKYLVIYNDENKARYVLFDTVFKGFSVYENKIYENPTGQCLSRQYLFHGGKTVFVGLHD